MFLYYLFVVILSFLLILINKFLSVKHVEFNKMEGFECGFEGFEQTRIPFSISFYVIGILFLIFDLEVALLFPYILSSYNVSNLGLWFILIFINILTVGFVIELNSGILKSKGD